MPSGESNTHILMQLSVPLLTITGSLLAAANAKHVSNERLQNVYLSVFNSVRLVADLSVA